MNKIWRDYKSLLYYTKISSTKTFLYMKYKQLLFFIYKKIIFTNKLINDHEHRHLTMSCLSEKISNDGFSIWKDHQRRFFDMERSSTMTFLHKNIINYKNFDNNIDQNGRGQFRCTTTIFCIDILANMIKYNSTNQFVSKFLIYF